MNIKSGSPTNLLLSSQMGTLSMNFSPSGQIMLISEARRTTRRALKRFLLTSTFFGIFCVNFSNRRHIIIYSSTSTTRLDKELLFCSFCANLSFLSSIDQIWSTCTRKLGQKADPLIQSLRYFPRIFSFISVNLHNLLGQEADPEERRSPGRRRWRASWWLF